MRRPTISAPSAARANSGTIAIDARGPQRLLMIGERGANSRVPHFTLDGKPLHSLKAGVRWPSDFDFQNGVQISMPS